MPGPHCRGRAGAPDESRRPQRVTLTLLHLLAAVHGAGGGPHPLLHHHVLAATAPLAPPGAGQGVLPRLLQHGHSHRRSRRCAEEDILITRSCHCKSAAVSRWQHRICSGHKTRKLWCCQYYNNICVCFVSAAASPIVSAAAVVTIQPVPEGAGDSCWCWGSSSSCSTVS